MIRMFIGFTLLLALFLLPLTELLIDFQKTLGLPPGGMILGLIIAAVAVIIFLKVFRIRDRFYTPLPGMHLMTFVAAVLIGIILIGAVALSSPGSAKNPLLFLMVVAMALEPIRLAAEVLLTIGVFQVLANLLPSPSWKDYQ